ncbi:carbohydrate ABC transporter membrane protein 2 (CUT1 family) [Phyllobacterium leguminum]|uniref:Carbohydrate ABC transporter membrane protein 2 (CUT1 family) n=2 Tax=Phyllobacterium leguminum TaxID=314237 RepID=A0A318T1Y1_9HYPH|nr:carbohydrate ABC transporter membrane protein 2 (CUT1 family) [Phyllobacterium leguminum]
MKRTILLMIGLVITAVYLFPLYWMYLTAFKDGTEIFHYPPSFWPANPQWNFLAVWKERDMGRYIWNSLVIAIGVTFLVTLLGTGCAYVLARVRNIWMDMALFAILMMQVLPSSLMVTPIFVAFNQIGLLASPRFAVILAQTAKMLPLYIVLCRATFVQVPRELEDAALVDGSSRIGAFFNIMLPLAKNGILVTSVLIFLQSFGEYVYARSLISKNELQTATVGLQTFMGPNANDWNGIMIYAAIYVTPILLVFMLLQRRIVSGLTAGALK